MTANELRKKFVHFFVQRGHKQIPSASLIPENDPTTLFISAGMHPLVPYLLGEPHPLGKKLCSVQKCLRTDDIDNIGDGFHHTFFEMLGNWSLGDYWKEAMIPSSFEFLTEVLKIPIEKISVSCFVGDKDAPKDEETANLWKEIGIPKERIYFFPKKDNWWGPAGRTGPCGPDTEMFVDVGKEKCGPDCNPSCQCGKYIEVWNDVFMQYNKTSEGKYEPLKQKNIDTGMGVERVTAITSGFADDDYQIELFWPIIQKIEKISGKSYEVEGNKKPMRIIADHLRAAVFVLADGIVPSNVEQGYVLRRLIRRAVDSGKSLFISKPFSTEVAEEVILTMGNVYPEIVANKNKIFEELTKEEVTFLKLKNTMIPQIQKIGMMIKEKTSKELDELLVKPVFSKLDKENKFDYKSITSTASGVAGTVAFQQKSTFGMPIEETKNIFEKYISIDENEFEKPIEVLQQLHQNFSRVGIAQRFAGGLADHSEQVVKYHTATHLLHAVLRKVLGPDVHQVGSNITEERLRFDFTWPEKLFPEQIKEVEELVNEQIKANLPVKMEIMSLEEAKKKGALAFFEQKYGEQVKVYSAGEFSKEVCGGPHVNSTGEIGGVKIIKEESSGAGKRRIYAVLS